MDSVQIYKKLNIGSAKPCKSVLKKIPHHLVDIIEPDQIYSAGKFVRDATQAIDCIYQKKKIPILIGGNWLYVSFDLWDGKFTFVNKKTKLQTKTLFEI